MDATALVVWTGEEAEQKLFFSHAVRWGLEHDLIAPRRIEEFRTQLVAMANEFIDRQGVKSTDSYILRKVLQIITSFVSMGLERLSEGDLQVAAQRVSRATSLVEYFRTAWMEKEAIEQYGRELEKRARLSVDPTTRYARMLTEGHGQWEAPYLISPLAFRTKMIEDILYPSMLEKRSAIEPPQSLAELEALRDHFQCVEVWLDIARQVAWKKICDLPEEILQHFLYKDGGDTGDGMLYVALQSVTINLAMTGQVAWAVKLKDLEDFCARCRKPAWRDAMYDRTKDLLKTWLEGKGLGGPYFESAFDELISDMRSRLQLNLHSSLSRHTPGVLDFPGWTEEIFLDLTETEAESLRRHALGLTIHAEALESLRGGGDSTPITRFVDKLDVFQRLDADELNDEELLGLYDDADLQVRILQKISLVGREISLVEMLWEKGTSEARKILAKKMTAELDRDSLLNLGLDVLAFLWKAVRTPRAKDRLKRLFEGLPWVSDKELIMLVREERELGGMIARFVLEFAGPERVYTLILEGGAAAVAKLGPHILRHTGKFNQALFTGLLAQWRSQGGREARLQPKTVFNRLGLSRVVESLPVSQRDKLLKLT